jgi:ethanolamine utilization protein EutQ (cupin superfamily)
MSEKMIKVAAKDIQLKPVTEVPRWVGSRLAEIFDSSGKTRMACGIHEIFKSETVEADRVVDDLLYILEGQIEIRMDGRSEVFRQGDFAYVAAGTTVIYAVQEHVKLIYVVYPADWKAES